MNKFEKFKTFVKEHKWQIIGAAACIAGGVLGTYLGVKQEEKRYVKGFFVIPEQGPNGFIDEDIFTNIAPQIENLVMAEGCDEGLVEQMYTVRFPKSGDPANGYYGVKKLVKVLVQDAGDADV